MIHINRLLRKNRVLFVIDGCEQCAIWKSFIERLNSQIKLNKRIRVIDATLFSTFGIVTHPLLRVYDKYLKNFPILFFENTMIERANTRVESEAYIRSALHHDFIVPATNTFISDRECRYEKTRFGRKIVVCSDED